MCTFMHACSVILFFRLDVIIDHISETGNAITYVSQSVCLSARTSIHPFGCTFVVHFTVGIDYSLTLNFSLCVNKP